MTSNQNRKQQIKIKNINKSQSKATGQMAAEVYFTTSTSTVCLMYSFHHKHTCNSVTNKFKESKITQWTRVPI